MTGISTRVLLILAIVAAASRSEAAAINITISHVPLSTTWNLQLDNSSGVGLSALAMLVSDSLVAFTPVDARVDYEPPICPGAGCDIPGFNPFSVTFSPPLGLGSALLGYFTAASTDSIVSVLPGDDAFGGTVFDAQLTPLDPSQFSITLVPEPGVTYLLLCAALAIGGVGSIRLTRP